MVRSAQEVSVTFSHVLTVLPLSALTVRMKPIRVASAGDVTVSSCDHPLQPCVVRRHLPVVGYVLKRCVGRASIIARSELLYNHL
jgi:hypothetical protein